MIITPKPKSVGTRRKRIIFSPGTPEKHFNKQTKVTHSPPPAFPLWDATASWWHLHSPELTGLVLWQSLPIKGFVALFCHPFYISCHVHLQMLAVGVAHGTPAPKLHSLQPPTRFAFGGVCAVQVRLCLPLCLLHSVPPPLHPPLHSAQKAKIPSYVPVINQT